MKSIKLVAVSTALLMGGVALPVAFADSGAATNDTTPAAMVHVMSHGKTGGKYDILRGYDTLYSTPYSTPSYGTPGVYFAGENTSADVRGVELTARTPEGQVRDLDDVKYGDTLVINVESVKDTAGITEAEETITAKIHSKVVTVGSQTVSVGKPASFEYKVGCGLDAGEHTALAESTLKGSEFGSAQFTINDNYANCKAGEGNLPHTGANAAFAAWALALVAGGAALTIYRRKQA